MSLLNLGIVAHVDAGKTSLTERLLFEAGAVDSLGRVDDGTTATDSMELERRRGITIRAAVTSFALDDLAVTILDTPGHPDFIAEVERSLTVLDAAVLVLSAVEGVQPQTVVLWRALRRIGVPTLLFVNKIDRSGADVGRVLTDVRRRLGPHVAPLTRALGEGTRTAAAQTISLTDEATVEAVAESDDRLLERWANAEPIDQVEVAEALRRATAAGRLAPVLVGSAVTGAGLPQLRSALRQVLPRASEQQTPTAASVFAVDHDAEGARRAWIRLWSGQIRVREQLVVGDSAARRVTRIEVSRPGGLQDERRVRAGEIAVLRGLPAARVGDVVGRPPRRRAHRFPPATLQALVEPLDPAQRTAMFAGLAELADEDPLIDLTLDEEAGEAAVRLHGEVQKEVIEALLRERYAVATRFLPTSVVCVERVAGTGTGLDRIKTGGNPYLATIGLRVEPAPVGSGVAFSPGVERGNLPPAFVAATEEGVRAGLRQGRFGWEVTDCLVTMTASGYYPRQSKPHQKFDKSVSSVAGDFRHLAPVVLRAALDEAGTRVCEPVDRVEVDLPDAAFGTVVSLLGRLGGTLQTSTTDGSHAHLEAHLATDQVPRLAARLPDLTGGEGLLVTALDHHAPVRGTPPVRARRGPDPADREVWFRDVPR